MFEERKCVVCGEEFTPKREKSITCSKRCYKKLEYRRYKKNVEKKCVYCGELFTTAREITKYCSQACVNSTTKKNDVALRCKECGEEFTVPFAKRNRQFCSKSCSTINANRLRDSEKVNKKISQTKKRQYASGEVAHPMVGKTLSEEHKKKISQARKDKGLSAGKNNPMFGKNHSRETCEKISKTRSEKIVNGEYDGWFNKGKHFSSKMNREMCYRSSWEKNVYEYLDEDNAVVVYDSEPFYLKYYSTTDKQHRNYIPDILITYKDGERKLIEIKPTYFLDAQINKDKFKAAREYCDVRGIIFEVWTEKEIEKLLI